ncbi:hypothetical protein IWW50_004421 [Coemansia erecta]|nr:hypothetical protein GGF43_002965 [Coemansia sp. RSA 2618]KAJ2821962.1 hypothetical protein IWW50_004421 [Coemansia erecta]
MAFEYTQQEQMRVKLAMLGGVQLDPIGHADLAVIAVLSSVYFMNFIAIVFLVWNRNYPPLKSKYPFLMAANMVAMFIFFLGDLVLKSHVHVRGHILSNCVLFCVWMRVIFGAYMVSVLTTIRSYALFCIFLRNRAFRGKYVCYSAAIAVGLAVVFIIVTYTLPAARTIHYIPLVEMCNMSYLYRALVQGLLWLVWIVNAAINFRLRNINSSFNESREMFVACICVFTLLAFNTIILYVHPLYPTNTKLRVTETLCSHVIANFLWWFIMYQSMYNCALRRDKFLSEWKDKLVRDGLQKQYQIARTDPFSVTMISVDSGNVGKLVSLPRGMVTDHDGFDARTSFSHHSAARSDSVNGDEHTAHAKEFDDSRLWRPESARQRTGDQFPFSPYAQAHHVVSSQENSSSTSTVNDSSRYDFPLPPKST